MRFSTTSWAQRAAAMLIAVAVAGISADAAEADRYTFDPGHTNVAFSWNNLGLSRQSGRLLEYDGSLEFDPLAPEQAVLDVTLKTRSVWTGVAALDRDLRSSDFLDAARHPDITFRSTSVRVTGEKTGEVEGNLTIMGQTHPVVLQVRWNYTGEHPLAKYNPTYLGKFVSGFSARTSIMRSAWGISRGIPLISDEIEISIETELTRK